jgi:predicted MPP superfamily phosphohydrolase
VRLRTLELAVDGLPTELEGLRIAHLSDFHLGLPSLGERATARAVDWVAKRRPDLVCVTGDLVSRSRFNSWSSRGDAFSRTNR